MNDRRPSDAICKCNYRTVDPVTRICGRCGKPVDDPRTNDASATTEAWMGKRGVPMPKPIPSALYDEAQGLCKTHIDPSSADSIGPAHYFMVARILQAERERRMDKASGVDPVTVAQGYADEYNRKAKAADIDPTTGDAATFYAHRLAGNTIAAQLRAARTDYPLAEARRLVEEEIREASEERHSEKYIAGMRRALRSLANEARTAKAEAKP